PAGAAVRRATGEDESPWELLDTPLMLNILAVAYAGQPDLQSPMRGTLNERRDDLFGAYVGQMFRRRGAESRHSPARTVHWLAWLAHQMASHSQTIFYLERLQLDWLPQSHRRTIRVCYGLVGVLGGLLIEGLAHGLLVGLGLGLVVGLYSGPLGLFYGLFYG